MVRYFDDESTETRRILIEEDLRYAPSRRVLKVDADGVGVDEKAARRWLQGGEMQPEKKYGSPVKEWQV